MKWKNLRAKRCPKCDHALVRNSHGYECTYVDAYYRSPCGFFITSAKFDEMIEKLKKP